MELVLMKRWSWAYWLVIALAALVVAFAPFPAIEHAQPLKRVIRVEAGQFSYSPSIISVNPGDTVTIQLVSTDVVHGLYVDGYGVSVQADPGQTETLTFIANRPGSFRIRCNVTCGAMHPFMIGKLNVGGNTTLVRSMAFALIGVVGLALFARPASPGAAN
jgi:heme/copper-type cytochrome/quinol oxidase subunit 2